MENTSNLNTYQDYGLDTMISQAKAKLEDRYKREPWTYTNHGKAIITDEQQLYAYLTAYGEMHKFKCLAAMQNMPYDELPFNLEIVDWGCGQGIATICMIEMLRKKDMLNRIKRICLIEPSELALASAEQHIRKALNNDDVEIVRYCKFLPSDKGKSGTISDLRFRGAGVLHLFSNILDITDISLKKTAEIITRSPKHHFIFTTCPVNANSSRLDEFCSYFNDSTCFSDICNSRYGYTSDTQHLFSCKAKCIDFISSGSDSFNEGIIPAAYSDTNTYDDYDRRAYINNGLMSEEFVNVYEAILPHLRHDDKLYIKPDVNGDRPDLVIVRRDSGLLIVNIFEEDVTSYHLNRNVICDIYESLDDATQESPISRALGYIDSFQSFHLSTVPTKNVVNKQAYYLVKSVCIFPKNTTKEVFASMEEEGRTPSNVRLLGMEMLQEENDSKFWDNLNLTYNRCADDSVYGELCSILKTEWHSCLEGEPVRLNDEQKSLVESFAHQRKIKGVAGSGKTQVLVTRAVNANKRTGKKVLILTFNITLISYIKYRLKNLPADFMWDSFEILNYHTFFKMQARNSSKRVYLHSFDELTFFDDVETEKYSTILIDEVQDYKKVWLRIIQKNFLAPKGEFILFGDIKQNIYHRDIDEKEKEIVTPIRGRWIGRLNKGYRFSNKLFTELVTEFQKHYFRNLEVDKIESNLFDEKINIEYFSQGISAETLYPNWLWLKEKYGIDTDNTVILGENYSILRKFEQSYRLDDRNRGGMSPVITFETEEERGKLREDINNFEMRIKNLRRTRKVHFTMDAPTLKLSSIHSFKGWEADTVILILQNPDEELFEEESAAEKIDNSPELIYTAITRAKKNLFVFNLGDKRYDQFFRDFMHGYRIKWRL